MDMKILLDALQEEGMNPRGLFTFQHGPCFDYYTATTVLLGEFEGFFLSFEEEHPLIRRARMVYPVRHGWLIESWSFAEARDFLQNVEPNKYTESVLRILDQRFNLPKTINVKSLINMTNVFGAKGVNSIILLKKIVLFRHSTGESLDNTIDFVQRNLKIGMGMELDSQILRNVTYDFLREWLEIPKIIGFELWT